MDSAPRVGNHEQMPYHLQAPTDRGASPAQLLASLTDLIGEPAAAGACVALLAGAAPQEFADVLPYLGGRLPGHGLTGEWERHGARIWGARGLLYVWDDCAGGDATSAVVHGLADCSWRVAENCLKVSCLREIGAAGDGAATLVTHRLPRVRAQAVRALGIVGDTEHVNVVRAAADDGDTRVRGSARKAYALLAERLDLPG